MLEKILLVTLLILQVQNGIEAAVEERLKQDFFSIYKHTAVAARNITDEPVTPDRINYFLYTKKNPEEYTKINTSDTGILNNKNVVFVFIIHGWTGSRENQWYEDLKNAFLAKPEDYYVIQVDWSEPAGQLYTVSSYSTLDVGKIVGEFLVGLHKNYSIPLDNFLLIGHSLGGQVCGFIGKKVQELTNKKLPRIIALDPAGPWFSTRPEDKRLNKTDAEVVEVVHTDGGTFGFKSALGTIDFFPNGGSGQPGCKRIDLLDITSVAEPVTCDHTRGYEYFVEAILNPGEFLAKKCSSWNDFKGDKCDETEQVALGDLKTRKTGEFYFETNKDKPFSKKNKEKSGGFGILKLLQH